MQFSVGDVFLWSNFPFIRDLDSTPKPRWFLYLGKTAYGVTPIIAYCCTSTQEDHHKEEYEPGGKRFKNLFLTIPKGEGGFTEASILDFTMNYYSDLSETIIDTHAADITIQGRLCTDRMRQIYKVILSARNIPTIQKRDIFNSFNLAGIAGLKRP